MAFRAPVLGYNTNVRHKGRLFHIQTEDSGAGHPHVITHLFADGGRIVASKKTAYSEQLGADNLPELVKKLMQAQHKQMFIALRDGAYDEESGEIPAQRLADVDALKQPADVDAQKRTGDAGAAKRISEVGAARRTSEVEVGKRTGGAPLGLYREAPPAQTQTPVPPALEAKVATPLFSRESDGQSLDEVILRYLAQEDREAT